LFLSLRLDVEMAALQCNIAKGREVELYERVRNNDPTNSAFILLVLAYPAQPLNTLQDYDTVSAMLGSNTEATNTNYARKTITALSAPGVDDTNNRVTIELPGQTWSGPAPSAGDTWAVGVIAYDDDTTGGTDANLIPISVFDCINQYGALVEPDGNPIVFFFNSPWLIAA
jgi:hypothetical protein